MKSLIDSIRKSDWYDKRKYLVNDEPVNDLDDVDFQEDEKYTITIGRNVDA